MVGSLQPRPHHTIHPWAKSPWSATRESSLSLRAIIKWTRGHETLPAWRGDHQPISEWRRAATPVPEKQKMLLTNELLHRGKTNDGSQGQQKQIDSEIYCACATTITGTIPKVTMTICLATLIQFTYPIVFFPGLVHQLQGARGLVGPVPATWEECCLWMGLHLRKNTIKG